MKSHELANALLALPDCDVIGMSVGQGAGEGGDDDLVAVIVGGQEPAAFKSNKWTLEPGEIGLWFGVSPESFNDNGSIKFQ